MYFGFAKIACATPVVALANPEANAKEIINLIGEAEANRADLLLFPELCLTGYTCADLLLQPQLWDRAAAALDAVARFTARKKLAAVVGLPIYKDGALYNCAAVIHNGAVRGLVPKRYIPNYAEFYEARWFAAGGNARAGAHANNGGDKCANNGGYYEIGAECVPFGTDLLFGDGNLTFGIEICEDLWVPQPPSGAMAQAGAQVILNLSATDEMVGKHQYLVSLVEGQSARTQGVYAYCSAGDGESTTDLVFSGNGMVAENGVMLAKSKRFQRGSNITYADADITKVNSLRAKCTTFAPDTPLPAFRRVRIAMRNDTTASNIKRTFNPTPFIPSDDRSIRERCEEVFNIQVWGLARRMQATRCKKAVVGISGGLDSTLALMVAARTFDALQMPRKDIIGVTMPGFGTTGRTYNNALKLMEALGVECREISIKAACAQHFSDIGLDPSDRSTTYENCQARERTQILMDIANRDGGLVVGTGDLSELALGWATYNGDQMSMYGVNASVPKTLVKYLVAYTANDNLDPAATPYLLDIIDTPISPELLPADEKGDIAQRTEDLVGPYILHDFFIYHYMRFGYSPQRLLFMANRAFAGQFESAEVEKWLRVMLRRFYNQQFKRSAMPDGPKVGSVSLSPRGDWRMPSDAQGIVW